MNWWQHICHLSSYLESVMLQPFSKHFILRQMWQSTWLSCWWLQHCLSGENLKYFQLNGTADLYHLCYLSFIQFTNLSFTWLIKPCLTHFTYNSLFSVMEKLPPTSYVRLVDIWLISTQLVPFLLVVMTTTIELFQEQGADINHHGRPRSLKLLEIKHMYMTRNLLI